mmetsp:Transcript_26282/g.57575  ORF Transcript_26282/g.57575 Transcript_26282/m.57575 type:complete len:242 (-) Transcript_26282:146-871(-)|eukprot:CAMPEP_0168180216 /NCGR_PEP_ID=MMETSP0139_2-20121125/10378_1 /TAXON_ID=44445 /ORGANISM="Pseudo-nitzschia australis, Strain 10249 10 AB" /LENGTH=241 /DNA_ID=CAMNT_0008100337 /DNA_START=66 /DNA_END=791 /DNA_ORIENTATION=+
MATISPSTPPLSLTVKKFRDSIVIGSCPRSSLSTSSSSTSSSSSPSCPKMPSNEPRVISCNFEMTVPTNALRINITIIVSTKSDNYNNDNPSLSYKITMVTPKKSECESQQIRRNADGSITTTTTTSTLRWNSKFTVAKRNDDVDPFHEWTGNFVFNKKPIDVSECLFHQLEGTFDASVDVGANSSSLYSEHEPSSTPTNTTTKSTKLPLLKRCAQEEALMQKKRRRIQSDYLPLQQQPQL